MQIGILGPLEVRTDDGVVVDVPGARLRGLLIALACEPGQVVPKAALVDWIWGEQPPSDATNALQRLVSRLRKALPDGLVEGRPGGYRLMVGADAVDASRFEYLIDRARNDKGPQRARLLHEALALWRGAAMQDVESEHSATFHAAVTRLEALRLTATEDMFEAKVDLGHGVDLIPELTDLVAAQPVRERLVAALMRALVAARRDTEALVVFQRTREALADALGVDPSPELSELHVAVLRGELGQQREIRKTNLRAELSSFVGKDADVTAICDLIAAHRLITLIGPGGAGKTRLATESARTVIDDLPDGAWLVDLATIRTDGNVAQVALSGLGLRDALRGAAPDTEPSDRLIDALRDREMLLILDNCEHVIESAAEFAQRALGECHRLRILATSREPLGIPGESLWLVEPLAWPEEDATPGEIAASPAVRLLRERAAAVRADLGDDAMTWSAMARVCRTLDGMPLAIELAAARLRSMSLDQLAHRLHDRFRLLTVGSRTALPRHRTLRAVVDWSWELLTDAERMVLRRLSVFSDGASLEAAEQVCAGDGVEREQVLELLTSLAEKSLLLTDAQGAPRFRLIGTIKEYAGHRQAETGESDVVRRAHLTYFTELAETADPHLRRAEQVEWLATLEAEHDNIVAAMHGALEAGEAEAATRLAAGAGWYWWLSGHKAEGIELIVAATRTPGSVPDEARAMACALVALFLTSGRGDERRAEEWIHEAHRLSRDGQRRYPVLRLVAPLARMLQTPGAYASAFEPLLDDADPWVRALARLQHGKTRIMLGQGGDAQTHLEQALAQFRAIGERYGISFAQTELADQRAARGELAGACEHYEQAIEVVIELGAVDEVIRLRSRQARLYWLVGDEASSAAAIRDAERFAEDATWPHTLAELVLAKAELARWKGDADRAYQHLEAATTVLGEDAAQADIRAARHDLLGYLAEDLNDALTHRRAACEAASEARHAPLIAQVLIGVADLALRRDQPEQAVRLLAASAAARGLPDHSHPDLARIEQSVRHRLSAERYTDALREGTHTIWSELATVTLRS